MKKRIIVLAILFILIFSLVKSVIYATNNGSIRYQVHLQDKGWIDTVYDGRMAGTTGEARRMEAIAIAISGVDGTLSYKVHIQDYGWLKDETEGIIAGTTGQSKRMEAIIINLNNSSYIIRYRVHVQDYGWMDWVTSGQVAGTTGQSKRIEAIQIVVEKKMQNNSKILNTISEKNINTNGGNNGFNSNNYVGDSNSFNDSIHANISNNANNNLNSNIDNNINNNINNNIDNHNDSDLNKRFNGIDVSKFQGDINWKKVKQSGIDFAMIRGAYRGYTEGHINEDIKFLTNVKNAYANGIKVGLYFYSSAINEVEAKEEAEFILKLINKYGINNYITYPIAIDIEDFEGTRNYSLSIKERTNIVKEFCKIILNNGFKPMVYSYTYFLETKLNMDDLSGIDTWIADYYGNMWYKRKYTMWQYSDKGNIDGIIGDVDLNYSYINY